MAPRGDMQFQPWIDKYVQLMQRDFQVEKFNEKIEMMIRNEEEVMMKVVT